jgi:hypothetical protein
MNLNYLIAIKMLNLLGKIKNFNQNIENKLLKFTSAFSRGLFYSKARLLVKIQVNF